MSEMCSSSESESQDHELIGIDPSTKTPRAIMAELDRHVIGQNDAKRAVAIALRNRWRRMKLPEEMRHEVTPKNILMIGPTGVGKTEIARRLARLVDAPFIKVEATKFTEVGYVGRDVEQIIRDLMEIAIKCARDRAIMRVKNQAIELAVERVLDILVPVSKNEKSNDVDSMNQKASDSKESATRSLFRKKLRSGALDDKEIEIDLEIQNPNFEIMGPPGTEEMMGAIQSVMKNLVSRRTQFKRLKVKDALKHLQDEESAKLLNDEDIKTDALRSVEENGIVVIDEIDKIAEAEHAGHRGGSSVSREGVQRDLLPLVEGCVVSTKHGLVKTDHILFIGSGAFHIAKPSDLIPELQGRLPIRVELNALNVQDYVRILTEPQLSLTEQYILLLKTENFHLQFTECAIQRIAEIAFHVNSRSENIGARRLHTILERLLDVVSFEANERCGETCVVDGTYVNQQLQKIVQDEDLSRYIL